MYGERVRCKGKGIPAAHGKEEGISGENYQ